MSGLIDCMVVVASDLGKIAAWGAQDAAFMAKTSAANIVAMSKEFMSGFVNGIGDSIKALQNLAVEEKRIYKEAFNKYEQQLHLDQTKKSEYVRRILNDYRVKELEIDIDKIVNDMNANTIIHINEVFKFACLYHKYNDALIELSAFEDILSLKGEVNELKDIFKEYVSNNKYENIYRLNDKLSVLTNQLLIKIHEVKESMSNYSVSKLEEIYIALSSDVGDAYIYLFNNELMELLNKEDEDESLGLENKLMELKKEMINYALKLNDLEYLEGTKECQDLIEYVYSTLKNEKLSNEVKIERVELRVNALKDNYLKCEQANKRVFDLKEKFDEVAWRNYSYKSYLNMEATRVEFNSITIEDDIKQLEKENQSLYELCEKKRKNVYLRKILKEAMIENELEYVTSKESNSGKYHIDQDIYHIDNGNVVAVTINDNGALNYYVSKVEIDGISNSEENAVESMNTFCEKYKSIEKKLKENGIQIKEKRRLEPDVKYVHTIDVDEEAKVNIKNKIKKSHSNKSRELKKKHVGE